MEFRSLAQSPAHRSSALRSNHAAQGNVQLRLETSMDGDSTAFLGSLSQCVLVGKKLLISGSVKHLIWFMLVVSHPLVLQHCEEPMKAPFFQRKVPAPG